MADLPVNIFYMGKGGVGKSTLSALKALELSEGKKVLLVSMDPAHNQSDIFSKKFSNKPLQVRNNLWVTEIDIDAVVKKYLNDIENQVRKSYNYLTAFNLEKNFKIIKFSPGIEEYALLLSFMEIRKEHADKDCLIFDMPPTALTLRFFSLPSLSLLWNEQLLKLRREIIKKKEMITKVKMVNKEKEKDKILNKLTEQNKFYNGINKLFQNELVTKINLVLNPDVLSISESKRIIEKMKNIGLKISNINLNKTAGDAENELIKNKFAGYKVDTFLMSKKSLIGIDSLSEYLYGNIKK